MAEVRFTERDDVILVNGIKYKQHRVINREPKEDEQSFKAKVESSRNSISVAYNPARTHVIEEVHLKKAIIFLESI